MNERMTSNRSDYPWPGKKVTAGIAVACLSVVSFSIYNEQDPLHRSKRVCKSEQFDSSNTSLNDVVSRVSSEINKEFPDQPPLKQADVEFIANMLQDPNTASASGQKQYTACARDFPLPWIPPRQESASLKTMTS